jgi:hypothetical protein
MLEFCDGVGANLDVCTARKSARAGHLVVILNLATPRTMQNKIVIRFATTTIDYVSIWMIM